MKNNIITLLALFLLANCTLIPTDERIIEPPNFVTINTDSTIQAQYKAEWLALTSTIDKNNAYTGSSDIWGGGELDLNIWFQEGDLWDYMDAFNPENPYVLHTLVESHRLGEGKSSFVDGNTAIMVMPASASPALEGVLYVVRISNETIYRTYNEWGVNFIEDWDGKQVDIANLVPIGKKQ